MTNIKHGMTHVSHLIPSEDIKLLFLNQNKENLHQQEF